MLDFREILIPGKFLPRRNFGNYDGNASEEERTRELARFPGVSCKSINQLHTCASIELIKRSRSSDRPKLAPWVFDAGRFLATKDVLFHVFSHRDTDSPAYTVLAATIIRAFCRSRATQHDGARDMAPSMSR